MQTGEIKSMIGTAFWRWVMAEMTRQQANQQIIAARSLTLATWALAGFTALLVAVTAITLVVQICGR
jgi:hypothetical protein